MKEGRWAGVSPWIIIGAVLILAPIFVLMTVQTLDRQRSYTTKLLMDRGDALIRSFEAGARTGSGFAWGPFHLQKLLMETAQQPGIDYLVVTDENGVILADSDPSQVGETFSTDLDLKGLSVSSALQWRRVPNPEGADTFEVYRRFRPAREDTADLPGPPDPGAVRKPPATGAGEDIPHMVIFVGLDMGPLEAARSEDVRHAVMMAAIFLLIGLSGIISLMLAQGYRSARTSLSRVRAFSDSLVENMPMGLVAMDEAGRITAFNQTAESVLQRPSAEAVGRSAEGVLPDACRRFIGALQGERRIVTGEADCPTADGRSIPLEVIAATLTESGRPAGAVLLFRDVTEIRRLKKEIDRSRHLASLGSLAAGVAHEIRNPLSSIKGFATYFRERYRDNPEDAKTAGIMIREVDRLNRVISQLLDYARPMTMQRTEAPLQEIIGHTLRMIEKQAAERGVALEADLPAHIPAVSIDADRMQQVLLNLYLNALEATAAGGMLSVSLGESSDGRICIRIRDTGTGIPPEDLGRIFDPYFTTKPSGAGLGLAIVQKILDAHHAEIQMESEPGRGTTATVLLPANGPEGRGHPPT